MHDSLQYMSKEPIYRQYHHGEMTFSLVYAFSENFVLPISHDEVVHGKGSLLRKMPGDRWQQLANLRAFLAYMWATPASSCSSWARSSGRRRSGRRTAAWTGGSRADPRATAALQQLVRDLNRLYREHPRCGSSTPTTPGSSGSTRTTPRQHVLLPPQGLRRPADRRRRQLRRRSRTRTTGSACRTPAAGGRCSTRTPSLRRLGRRQPRRGRRADEPLARPAGVRGAAGAATGRGLAGPRGVSERAAGRLGPRPAASAARRGRELDRETHPWTARTPAAARPSAPPGRSARTSPRPFSTETVRPPPARTAAARPAASNPAPPGRRPGSWGRPPRTGWRVRRRAMRAPAPAPRGPRRAPPRPHRRARRSRGVRATEP